MSDNKYYFESAERQQKLRQILASWEGTPYRHWCGVKRRGADCIQFVGNALYEAGVISKPHYPHYPPDWHLHRDRERLLDGILGRVSCDLIDPIEPANGDILLFRFGRASAHSAVYMDGHTWQSVTGIGVIKTPWGDHQWKGRVTHCLRIKEKAS